MKHIAIIPARSGSKGLKDKNIKQLNKKPLIAYSIEAALESKIFDEIMVSTDSEKYAEIAKSYGAQVPFLRNQQTSSDSASSWEVVREVIKQYNEIFHKEFDTVTLLQPTSPLRDASDLINSRYLFESKQANAVISVCLAEHSPLWCNTLGDELSMKQFSLTDKPDMNRQQLKQYYRLNGAIYILNHTMLNKIEQLYDEKCYAFVMEQEKSIDIDSELDFLIAEMLMKYRKKNS